MNEPETESTKDWSDEMRAEFRRRRRGRNVVLLVFLVGLCVLIYAISVVKLFQTGHMW